MNYFTIWVLGMQIFHKSHSEHEPLSRLESVFSLNITKHGINLTIEGDFSKEEEILYANYAPLNIYGSSQDPHENRAKVKAVMRLFRQIELKLMYHRKLNSKFSSVFAEGTSLQKIQEFDKYAQALPPINQEGIQVEKEELLDQGNGWYLYQTEEKMPVSDLSVIQEALHSPPGERSVEEIVVVDEFHQSQYRALNPPRRHPLHPKSL